MECKYFYLIILFLHIFNLWISNFNYNSERYTEIERENRILLEKMSNIMQNPKPSLYNPRKRFYFDFKKKVIALNEKRSLNRDRRRRDLVKITMENQAFLKRL